MLRTVEGEAMTRNSLLCILASAILANCSLPINAYDTSSDEALSSTESSALSFCTALSDCTAPFDGVPVSCTGAIACAPFPDRVVCDGRVTFCHNPPPPCTATLTCESGPTTLSCTGRSCTVLGALDNKVCGGVQCDGVARFCPPLPGDLECF